MSSDYNIITVVRCLYRPNGAVIGRLFINDKSFCHTLECSSVMIPEGTYKLALDVVSPFFKSKEPYKSICKGCIPRLLDVPNRSGILFHIGNFTDDTSGCILVGDYSPSSKHFYNMIRSSKDTFIKFYKYISQLKYPIKVCISSL